MPEGISSRTIADSIISSLIHMTKAVSLEKAIEMEKAKLIVADFIRKEILPEFGIQESEYRGKYSDYIKGLANHMVDMSNQVKAGVFDVGVPNELYTTALQLREKIKEEFK